MGYCYFYRCCYVGYEFKNNLFVFPDDKVGHFFNF